MPSFNKHRKSALPDGVDLIRLKNGLTLILKEDHSAPVTSAQAWCGTGSIHEGPLLGAGVSHLLEHMLFKGTSSRKPGTIDNEIQNAGGYMNAYTSFDRTVYWINVPNDGTILAVDILCDIVQNASLPEDELDKEKQVIYREMDMNQDDPGKKSSRRFFESIFQESPYRYTIIGYPEPFDRLDTAEITNYYKSRYLPSNIVLIVTGDFDSSSIKSTVEQSFQNKEFNPVSSIYLASEPRQLAYREIIETDSIQTGFLHYGWQTCDVRHPDTPALDVLSVLLGNGRSSRLYQAVREKEGLVQSVDAWTFSSNNLGLFGLSAVMETDQFERACESILNQVTHLKKEGIRSEELDKAKRQFECAHLSSCKTMQGQAQDLGSNWMVAGDLNFSERYLNQVRDLDADAILEVVEKHLRPENLTLYSLQPVSTESKRPIRKKSQSQFPIRKESMESGYTLLTKEDHRLPFVQIRIAFQCGVLAETQQNNGLTQLLSSMLMKGTSSRTAEQIAEQVESTGGSLDAYAGNNSIGIAAEFLSKDLETGLHIIADVLSDPIFPESAFEREKNNQLTAIKSHQDHLLKIAELNLKQKIFGSSSYGLDSLGTDESVKQLSKKDLTNHFTKWMVPGNAVVSVFGDIPAESIVQTIHQVLGKWNPSGKTPILEKPSVFEVSGNRVEQELEKKQAVFFVGFPGVS
ncbi:MAG TPA: insulinase family protein, partial [Verrucomicrobiales bacterium]|nr:insulinase family protein [Verrucomicrobiales bacterium]HIL70367.1 insulinase family protein [Verrucomicrobiota bacterium]